MKHIYITLIIYLFIFPKIKGQIIPIEYNRHIYLKGSLNGEPLSNFIFDTGADILYVDSSYHIESNMKFDNLKESHAGGAGTTRQKVKIIRDELSFDFSGNIYESGIGIILNLRSILGDFVDGMIGKVYFKDKAVEVDYVKKYMKIYDSILDMNLTEYKRIETKFVNNRILVPITIKITEDINVTDYFLLDLGSGGSIDLTSPAAKKYGIDSKITDKAYYYTTRGGIGGESRSYDFNMPEVSIGGYVLKDVIVRRSLDRTGALSSSYHAGLLGNDILSRFDLVIDFKNNDIYVKPNGDINKPFNNTTFGFSFTNNFKTLGHWVVNGFYKGFSAEKSGMKINDRIIEVNGIPTKEINTFELQAKILDSDSIKLKMERNNSPLITVTLVRETKLP